MPYKHYSKTLHESGYSYRSIDRSRSRSRKDSEIDALLQIVLYHIPDRIQKFRILFENMILMASINRSINPNPNPNPDLDLDLDFDFDFNRCRYSLILSII